MARGGITGEGTLLDTLVVKIDCDLSGLQRGIAQAIAEVRTLKGALTAQVGGVSLGDAMTAALVAPVIVATARIGQMRTELRLLTTELRAAALLTAGPGAAGRNAGSLVPFAAAAGGAVVLDAANTQGRTPRGRFTDRRWRVEGDDLAGAAAGDFGGDGATVVGVPPLTAEERYRRRYGVDPPPHRRAGRPPGPFAGAGHWFGRIFGRESERTAGAFERGRAGFPGFGEASDNLGGAAHGVGNAARRTAGGRIASMLGLVGVGALFGDLLKLAASLATVVGGTLAGAFAALLTPLGLVVAAIASFVGLFVAANWENIKEFANWIQERFVAVVGPSWNKLMASLGEAWQALVELFRALWNDEGGLKPALQELWVVAEPIFKLLGEIVVRVAAAIVEALAGIVSIFTELIRTITALVRGDWAGAWEHAKQIVAELVGAIGRMFMALLPEVTRWLTGIVTSARTHLVEGLGNIVDWCAAKLQWLGDKFKELWERVVGNSYIPDLVDGIEEHFGRLQGAMVDPVVAACSTAAGAFEQLSESAGESLNDLEGILTGLTEGLIRGQGLPKDMNSFGDLFRKLVFSAGDRAIGRSTDLVNAQIGGLFDWIRGGTFATNSWDRQSAPGQRGLLPGEWELARQGAANQNGGGDFWSGIFRAFGSLFSGGGRAGGGFVLPGMVYDVGELGRERLVMGRNGGGVVVPANDGGRGRGASVVNHFHFPPGTDARSFQQSRGRIEAMMLRTAQNGRRNL